MHQSAILKGSSFFVCGKNSKGIQDVLSEQTFVHLRCHPSPVWTKVLNYWQKIHR